MMPTLLVGDFILVNKFVYGIRLPVSDEKIFEVSHPERGDVVVFRYPLDPSTPFIKRVVGLPGDRIAYYNKVLYVNGQQADQRPISRYAGHGSGARMTGASLRQETLGAITHPILVQDGYRSVDVKLVVPDGHYFVLGDNRDNSRDSRYWGTVPDELLIGKAFTIWMNWDLGNGNGPDWARIGTSID
jgi:signal peptidase I